MASAISISPSLSKSMGVEDLNAEVGGDPEAVGSAVRMLLVFKKAINERPQRVESFLSCSKEAFRKTSKVRKEILECFFRLTKSRAATRALRAVFLLDSIIDFGGILLFESIILAVSSRNFPQIFFRSTVVLARKEMVLC